MARPLARVLLALVVAAAASFDGRIHCIGADGHHEIERRDAACCARGGAEATVVDARCAAACVDTPISLSALGQRTERLVPVFVVAADLPPETAARRAPRALVAGSPASAPPRPPRALATTVRRC
jgi:hypothetical protein